MRSGETAGTGNSGLFVDLEEVFGAAGNGFGNTANGPNDGIQAPTVAAGGDQ